VPLILISILAVITWKSSHDLDPFKPLNSSTPPMTIQVVSLQWKWLFIYPKQNIATVNLVQFPVNTPISFEITSDAPMNSFWIPQLGGQIYAMSGMSTHLQLMASQPGEYRGESANISGAGFAGMHFSAKASSAADFDQWVQLVRLTKGSLSDAAYNKLAAPTQNDPVSYYSSVSNGLYNTVVDKYMAPLYLTPAKESR
jgi:cytochrome o ubiquinol oxidase subunit II